MNTTSTGEQRVDSPVIHPDTRDASNYQMVDIFQKRITRNRHSLNFLTYREREVLRLVADGNTDRMVAETLFISPRTVNRHLCNIFTKLCVPGRTAAVALAIRQGLF